MIDRTILKENFLKENKFDHFQLSKLKADASFRVYERLRLANQTFILMDAPPNQEKILPFFNIANFLYEHNFSVPKIFAQDLENGFFILEDFGDDLYSLILSKEEHKEEYLYKAAINNLIKLQNTTVPENLLPEYDDETLIEESLLFTQWYLPILNGEAPKEAIVEEFKEILAYLLQYTKNLPKVMVHRDYHAENLMWLDDREGTNRVGIIDFQDAVMGSPIYDIVSLLLDVRRNVSPIVEESMITHYLNQKQDITRKDFLASYTIFSVQRNLKIMGFVARKLIRDKNSGYFSLLPRALKHVESSSTHPLLKPLKNWLDKVISPGVVNEIIHKKKMFV